jgi:hypothetical protein
MSQCIPSVQLVYGNKKIRVACIGKAAQKLTLLQETPASLPQSEQCWG